MNKKTKIVLSVLLAAVVAGSAGTAVVWQGVQANASAAQAPQTEELVTQEFPTQYTQAYEYNEEMPEEEYTFNDWIEGTGITEADRRVPGELKINARSLDCEANKSYIYDRMLNTADFYDTVSGKYRQEVVDKGISYEISYAAQQGGESMEVVLSHGDPDAQVTYSEGNVIVQATVENYVPNTRAADAKVTPVHVFPVGNDGTDYVSMVRSESRIQEDEEGIPVYYYRGDGVWGLSYARASVSPQEMTMGYLSNFDNWDITGKETVAGRDCWKLEGTLTDEFYSGKVNASTFAFWVDVETGMLLKFVDYDADGNITETLETTEIQVNQPVSDELNAMGAEYVNPDAINAMLYPD